MTGHVLVVVDDLLFASKIQAVVRSGGGEAVFVRSPGDIEKIEKTSYVIVDLEHRRLDAFNMIETIRSRFTDAPIAGYCSHVLADLAAKAKANGVNEVFTKGEMIGKLTRRLAQL